MPITIGFQLRPVKKGYPYTDLHPLQVRVRVTTPETPDCPGVTKETRFGAVWPLDGAGEKLLVNPADWDAGSARVKPKSHPVNDCIEQLRAHLKDIYRTQKLVAPPTLGSVLFQVDSGKQPIHTVSTGWQTVMKVKQVPTVVAINRDTPLPVAYGAYIDRLTRRTGSQVVSPITLGRWRRGLLLLNEWANQTGEPLPACGGVTIHWLKGYHSWLQQQPGGGNHPRPISKEQASRFIWKVGNVLDELVEDDKLKVNPVRQKRWPKSDAKEVLYLEKEDIQKLFALNWSGTKGKALWWFLLMACTGLDYPDAVAYAVNRDSLERETAFGKKLVGTRLKPPCVAYDVPVLSEVELLFQIHPRGPTALSSACVNRYTSHIEDELGITWRITNKTARKTFGCLMLQAGYKISSVSRMLGHSRVSTSETHYCKVLGNAVDRDRQLVGMVTIVGNQIIQEKMA